MTAGDYSTHPGSGYFTAETAAAVQSQSRNGDRRGAYTYDGSGAIPVHVNPSGK